MRVGLLLFTITFIDINMPLIKAVLKHIHNIFIFACAMLKKQKLIKVMTSLV